MKVKVEACWAGGERHYFRLTLPDGRREQVTPASPQHWDRAVATEALDILENVYHLDRSKVRFDHH